ncbi:16S rRNA (cytidine(1402)-2'-O)-methyltransferase [Clostridium sp. MSJ-8]|uniref:16S rRNA (cytidine(1402)-2'-O)-methyltransferase n=1 Tax=Clostridium sp. MSJ-8 TaxID=2841510 RepID=UPI001C0E94E0|nr:16S rRNA (cytidine(1402)-2'-O)-methyltransferase [Clostridium sp. MSJ-8]MBU5488340.1 16S rRNA (cytidine(1402)-2'-O)-methyltransferase [Clostridium sp. MSJ-8]
MENGKLYLVPTPIGNLKDITLRALEVLKNVDVIAAEDTRQTLKLLNHFEIKKSLMSYHKHNEMSKGEDIISKLKSGFNVAIVTDAGTPGISDPGAVIVEKCIAENLEFEVLPGATAFTTALVYSGLDTTKFEFRGFISRDTKERRETIEEIKNSRNTIIIYESPYRIKSTLELLLKELGDRKIALCRELTKLHEEIIRGSIKEVIDAVEDRNIKGEFVIVISGKTQEQVDEENKEKWADIDVKQHLINLIDEGMTKKEAIKVVSKERGLSKNEVYKIAIDI